MAMSAPRTSVAIAHVGKVPVRCQTTGFTIGRDAAGGAGDGEGADRAGTDAADATAARATGGGVAGADGRVAVFALVATTGAVPAAAIRVGG
jgi:hypothetical protein